MATREHGLFRLLDTPAPDAAQGGCYITHTTGPCIDTGVLVEFEGTLTLSVSVLQELCEVAGFSFNAEALKLEADLATAERLLDELSTENSDLKEQLNAVGIAVAYASKIEAAPKKAPVKR